MAKTTALGELLKRRRSQCGYSRARAAELSGVNASTIETWEIGRVSKPPIHDVMRLAKVLSISLSELEQAVMADETSEGAGDEPGDAPEPQAPAGKRSSVGAIGLLERAIAVLDWSDADAAAALNTTSEHVEALRRGQGELSVLEVMALIAVLAAFPAGRGGATDAEIAALLAELRGTRT